MQRLTASLSLPVLLAAMVAGAYAQADFRSDTRLVLLHATVVDSRGHLVTDLPRDAFTVFENGVAQQLKTFNREDVPVSMGLLVDNSGSMRDKRQKVATAALEMVKASNPQDEVFIVNFNDDAILEPPGFTSDIHKMQESLSRFDTHGGTAMRDAITMSLDYLKQKAKHDKKILMVITDGDDNTSSPDNTLEKIMARVQQSNPAVLVYAIGLLSEEERSSAKHAQRALTSLTTASGGMAYFPQTLEEVQQLALNVAHEIRNQYTLTYSPSEQALDGSFRQIKVVAKGPNRLQVRTRSGYYATPDEKPTRATGAPSVSAAR